MSEHCCEAKQAMDRIAREGCFKGGPFDGYGRDNYAGIAGVVIDILSMNEVDVLAGISTEVNLDDEDQDTCKKSTNE